MKYACKFYQGCPMLEGSDEIIIKYFKKDREILDFVQKWESYQTVVLNVTQLSEDGFRDSLELFSAALKLHSITIMCSKSQDYFSLYENNLPYFFVEPCGTMDELTGQIRAKVSNVYVTNELGFYLPEIAPLCKSSNVKVRVIPNLAQSSTDLAEDDFTKFFIRPEDLYLYEDLIDVVEFYTPEDRLDAQNVINEVYKEGKWQGNLALIIYGIEPINNSAIMPLFGETRLKCKKKCCFQKCNICATIKSISKELDKKNIHFEKE